MSSSNLTNAVQTTAAGLLLRSVLILELQTLHAEPGTLESKPDVGAAII